MNKHTTNYYNTLILVAEDCPISKSEIPPLKGNKKSIANLQYELIEQHPYEFTSDDVLFQINAVRKGIPKSEWTQEREKFFSKGQPCFRSSPLTKRYGWGIHSNSEGKIALIRLESDDYRKLRLDKAVATKFAMKSKR